MFYLSIIIINLVVNPLLSYLYVILGIIIIIIVNNFIFTTFNYVIIISRSIFIE